MLVQGRLGLAICKDTGIPEQQALAAELGMDISLSGREHHAAPLSGAAWSICVARLSARASRISLRAA
jgi:hypothetical protein